MKAFYLVCIFLGLLATAVPAQDTADKPIVSKSANQKYAPLPNIPDCATLTVLRGDPTQGAAVVEFKFTSGCIVPWHWHTSSESAVPLSGLLEISMQNEKPIILTNGDYGYLPAKHIHQAKCTGSRPCAAIFILDAAFDIHYVDKSGAEIPTDQAIAAAEKLMSKSAPKSAH